MKNIPLTSESEKDYFSSFVYPLLEETRVGLSSSMKIVFRAPYAKTCFVSEAQDRKPESIVDLQRVGIRWTFGLVDKVTKDDNADDIDSSPTCFRVNA
nr:UvrD-like helicase, ATP-binding domain, P-loop containing nucleoside triphosphate hydrolase [Tanacetum cinerariifolium]